MSHKAYVFDYGSFQNELAPLLLTALKTERVDALIAFVQAERQHLTLPWEPSPLAEEWQSGLVTHSVQEIADIALTKYYDVGEDYGVGEHWHSLQDRLPPHSRKWLLGEPFGTPNAWLDPGAMGSYFQSPEYTKDARRFLAAYDDPHVRVFQSGLDKACNHGRGVYVTF
jgi:hypothetical protein